MNAIPLNFSAIEIDFSRKNVLIIEDQQEMRSILRDILRNCGADVKKIHMAANGDEAVAALKSARFDLVLCDLILGPGKNGQQVLEEAKYQSFTEPSCLWIMISAEKTSEAVTGAAEYQPDAYLLKPVTEVSLLARIAKIWTKKKAFAEIHQAMKRSDYAKAMHLCEQRLVSDKANAADLLRTKCNLLLIMGEYDRARNLLQEILAKRDFPWAKVVLAKVLLKKSDLETARNLLEETVAANPAYLEAHDLLAQTLQASGDLEGACGVLEHAIKLSPNSATRQKNLGHASLKIGRLENAERAFRKSVALGENSVLKTVEAYLGLAKACGANDKFEEAFKVLGKLSDSFPIDKVRLKTLAVEGMICHQMGNTGKAEQIAAGLNQAVAESPARLDSSESLEIARLLIVTGHQEQAVQLLQSEIKNNPEDTLLHQDVAGIFAHGGMSEEGTRLIETTRQEAIRIMNRGVLLVSKGQYEEAVRAMRDARIAMPANVRVLLNLAYVIITFIQKNGTTPELIEEARNSLLAANELSPGEPRFLRLMASLNELTKSAA